MQRFENRRKAGSTEGIVGGREIAPCEKRFQVRREEHIVGPTAVAGDDLRCQHVDAVDVRALLAIDLDIDEPFVHQLGDGRVGIDRSFRDVTPVAGAVADGDKYRLVLALRLGQRFRAPGIPIDWVMRMQQQIRIVRVEQPVGVSGPGSRLGIRGLLGSVPGRACRPEDAAEDSGHDTNADTGPAMVPRSAARFNDHAAVPGKSANWKLTHH